MKIKISKTWLVIIIVILIIIGYYTTKAVFKSPTEGLLTEKIQKGQVLQEVSETGSVKATEDISLGFKSIGRVAHLYVAVGDNVKKGDILADLDSSQLLAQLESAKAALSYAINQYDSGVAAAKDNLQSSYKSASNTLSDAYTKIYNAHNVVVLLQKNYFIASDQAGIKVSDSRKDIELNMQNAKSYLSEDIDLALSKFSTTLDNIRNDLEIIRTQCDEGIYSSSVSSTDKTSLDTQRAHINTALSNIATSQTSISSYKIALQKAEDRAFNSNAGDTVLSSQIKQAQANVDVLQSQLNDNYLTSPIDGTITNVNVKKGQIISSSQPVVNLLSAEPLEIKVAIYEQDIVNVKVGDSAEINLVAFPKQSFEGKVLSIDPAETVIGNVIYYQVTIEFPNQPEGVRSGMTADVTIKTNKQEDVLRIPKNAVIQIDGIETAQVVKSGKIENITITTGLEGNDYFEVTSGLQEGDEIVISKK